MARKKLKKDHRKRNFLIQSFILLFLFIGIGYAALNTNLNISGVLGVSRVHYEPDGTAYGIMEAGAKNRELVREYTGPHHDSFTEEPSKPIYYFYAENDEEGLAIQNKNNIIFAGHCWKIFRTTDTGGLKLLYNGPANEGQCGSTRPYSIKVGTISLQSLNSNYWYGTDFTYDLDARTFTLSGTTERKIWNASNGPDLVGKYTCKATSADATCSTLYYIQEYYSNTSGQTVSLVFSSYNAISSTSVYSSYYYGLYSVGYMYKDRDPIDVNSTYSADSNIVGQYGWMEKGALSINYWYADSISYDSSTGMYSLVNPYKVSSSSELSGLQGKYTFRLTYETTNSRVYYVAYFSGSNTLLAPIGNGEIAPTFVVGDSVSDNGNGTYSLVNPVTFHYDNWYSNNSSLVGKYTCPTSTSNFFSNSTSCSDPFVIAEITDVGFYKNPYTTQSILIAKERNGLQLLDTLLVPKMDWFSNYSNYGDYKYTCGNDSDLCTSSTLYALYDIRKTGYSAYTNHYWGTGIVWNGTQYDLENPVGLEAAGDDTTLSTHHYTCPGVGETTCAHPVFLYYKSFHTMAINTGEESVEDLLNNTLSNNTINSRIKSMVDVWYKAVLSTYQFYLEDTIYCNDRSIRDYGGWGDTASVNSMYLFFGENQDLSCPKASDSFSVSNASAQLTYPIGLMTAPEAELIHNGKARQKNYWLMTPSGFRYPEIGVTSGVVRGASVRIVNNSGTVTSDYVDSEDSYDIRPVISLKPGVEISSGDGSPENPYIVDTNN